MTARFVVLLFPFLLAGPSMAQVVITVDPAVRHQTINGWEVVAYSAQESPAFPRFRDELFDRLANEAGISRIRLEVRSGAENSVDYWALYQEGQIAYETWRANRYATVNDNSDPTVINAGGFHFTEVDDVIERIVLPLRARLAAPGESLYVNLNYVAFTAQVQGGQYLHANAEEYAEFMLAAFQHIEERFNFVPDAIEIVLEPDNVSQWSGTTLGRAIVATADRLHAAGYDPEFIAPSCTRMDNAVSYFDALARVPGAVGHFAELSYHRYGGVSDSALQGLAERAAQHGLRTSILEWWSDANGHEILHRDLKSGNNGAWEHGAVAGIGGLDNSMTVYRIDAADPENPVVHLNRKARLTRQYYRFIRRGAVRIGAATSHAAFDPLAFVDWRRDRRALHSAIRLRRQTPRARSRNNPCLKGWN